MTDLSLIIVPDADDPQAAEVYVDGGVGGHPYRFLLDTGAAKTSVVFDAYTATFPSIGTNASSGVFARHSEDLISVPDIQLGAVSKASFTVVRAAENAAHARNLIGMDFLKDFRCHFLFDSNRLLMDGDSGDGYPFQPLRFDPKFHPYVAVGFPALTASAVWDSGASITVVDINFIHKHPAFFQPDGHASGTDSTGATMETPMFRMAETLIGGQTFPPHRVAGVDLSPVNAAIDIPMDVILGYSTLSQANWLFDFPRQRWAISRMLTTP